MRVSDYLEIAAQRYPDAEGFVFDTTRLTFRQGRDYAHAIAARLQATEGLGEGAHVGILSRNDPRVTLAMLGVNYAGCAWMGLHEHNSPAANAKVAEFAGCDLLLFSSSLEEDVGRLKERCPNIRHWVCIDGPSAHGPELDRWVTECSRGFEYRPTKADKTAVVVPTGGTTGPSKCVIHTERAVESEIVHINMAFFSGRKNVRLLSAAPLSHAAGHLALGLLPTGGTSVILNGFNPGDVLETIEREKITHFFLPPTALYSLMAHPKCQETDFSSLQVVVVGAAPVAPHKFREAVSIFGPVMWESFGQSENLLPILVKRTEDYLRPDGSFREEVLKSTGRAWDYVRVEIMDEKGNIAPRGTRGELVVRSSMMMKCYHNNPEATKDVSEFGFIHTGDIGVMDEEGFVTIVDRKKDMIVSGGFNVFPAEVEAVINQNSDVLDCIVIGVPNEKWGEAVMAVVQLKDGRSLDVAALLNMCREHLGSVKTPKSVEVWPKLPRSPVGKLLRREVREKFWEGQWRSI